MKEEILSTFEHTVNKLAEILEGFSESSFNRKSGNDSWSAAQVADHILKSQNQFPEMISANTESVDRNPEEKREIIKNIFLDFSTKMKSPEFIIPTDDLLLKDSTLSAVKESGAKILEALGKNDISKECRTREMPKLGFLTGAEWAWFQIYHVQRHINQLQNISKEISMTK